MMVRVVRWHLTALQPLSLLALAAEFCGQTAAERLQPLPRMHVILCQRIHYNGVVQGFCYLSTNVMWFYQIYIYSGLIGDSHIWFNV